LDRRESGDSQVVERKPIDDTEPTEDECVFHVSCLKKAVGQFISTSKELPPLDEEGQLKLVLEEVLEFRERKLRRRVIKEYFIRWRGLPVEDAT
jgi:hypothetical protein